MYKNYHNTRIPEDNEKVKVWEAIVSYLSKFIIKDSTILDLGCGHCNFINLIESDKKYAADKYIDPKNFIKSKNITSIFGGVEIINKSIKNQSLDVIFASNFLEHLNDNDLEKYLNLINKKLKKEGLLILMQPNYKYCYKNYFDDYTHIKIWTDQSLSEYLISKNFKISLLKPKFLPFSMKSKLPKSSLLTKLYIYSPIKPLAGQMLIIAKNKSNG